MTKEQRAKLILLQTEKEAAGGVWTTEDEQAYIDSLNA